jgi:broad specificity phosphatase PhoE
VRVVVFAHGHLLRVLPARWVEQPGQFAQALLLSTASVSALGFGHHTTNEPPIQLWNSLAIVAPVILGTGNIRIAARTACGDNYSDLS